MDSHTITWSSIEDRIAKARSLASLGFKPDHENDEPQLPSTRFEGNIFPAKSPRFPQYQSKYNRPYLNSKMNNINDCDRNLSLTQLQDTIKMEEILIQQGDVLDSIEKLFVELCDTDKLEKELVTNFSLVTIRDQEMTHETLEKHEPIFLNYELKLYKDAKEHMDKELSEQAEQAYHKLAWDKMNYQPSMQELYRRE